MMFKTGMLALLLKFSLLFLTLWRYLYAYEIELIECPLPDYPEWGGYGPRQEYYVTGDVIHYYCDTDTYIGGNFYRRCEDTGAWSGDTPVCDSPARFSNVSQSSTEASSSTNDAESATDGVRSTCTSTLRGSGATWTGFLEKPGEMLRVMLFMPKVEVNYQVLAIKANGDEYSCGSRQGRLNRLEWVFHNCLQPNNTGIVGLKIKSLTEEPLQICEIITHVLTEPTCVDPHFPVDNGRFQLSRKRAALLCDAGFTRSTDTRLECIRNGVWNRKSLYCIERQWEIDSGVQASPDRNRQQEQ